jgi:hypothetical protein
MPQRLAVDCHHALDGLGKALHAGQEGGVEPLGIEQAERPAEGVVARDAMVQAQELPQERLLRLPEQRHVRAVLAAAEHRAERDDQQLVQVVTGIRAARVVNTREARNEILHGLTLRSIPCFESIHPRPRKPKPSRISHMRIPCTLPSPDCPDHDRCPLAIAVEPA